jgi:hypothetical protein
VAVKLELVLLLLLLLLLRPCRYPLGHKSPHQ